MSPSRLTDRITVLLIGVLVVLAPAVIVLITISFLMLTGDLVLGRVTPLEFFELYLIDLVLFAVFAYGLYRLTLTLIERQLPASLDALEADDTGRSHREASDDSE